MFLVILINALMGATFSIVKLILENYSSPIFLVGYRMTIAGTLLLGYLWLFDRANFRFSRQDLFSFIKIILFHVYISYIAEFWAQNYLTPAKLSLLFNLQPFITATFSYLMHRRGQSVAKLIGLVIGFVGFFPILFFGEAQESALGGIFFFSTPELVLFIAVASAAFGWLVVEHLVVTRKYSTLMVNGIGMLGGGLLATVTSYIVGNLGTNFERAWNPIPVTDLGKLTLWVLVLIVLSNIIFYNVYAKMMHKYSATFLSFTGLTIPLFAALWEWLIFGTLVSWPFWLSFAGVSLGLAIYYRAEMSQRI